MKYLFLCQSSPGRGTRRLVDKPLGRSCWKNKPTKLQQFVTMTFKRLAHFQSQLLVVSYPVLECTKDHPQVHSRKDLLHALFKQVMINILIVKFIVRDF